MGSPVRIAVLGWSDTVADYGLFMVMTYLTEAWKFNFRHSAAIVNLFWGFIAILPLALRFLKTRKNISHSSMLFISSSLYILGLGLLTFSSPKSESGKMDSWNATYAKYGVKQETLLYASLPLIVLAKSGYAVSLEELINEEKQVGGISDKIIHFSLSNGAYFLINLFGYVMSYAIKEWLTRFGIPTICMVVATLIFLTGFSSYGKETTQEPSLYAKLYDQFHELITQIIKNITSLLGLFIKIALCPLRLCCCCFFNKGKEKDQDEEPSVEEKPEIITRVEETKFLISLFPICLLGLVSSLGNTYFLEQAYSMNRKIIGNLKVPLVILLSVYKIANYLFPKLYFDIVDSWIPFGCTTLKKALHRIGIMLSLLCALLCCIIAAEVESKRIGILNKRNDPSKINEPVEMNLLYLVPQFFLLGGFYGMAYESIERFFKDHEIPPSLEPYMIDSAVGVFGLGNIGSVLLVYLVSKFTFKEGKSWFNESINTSRLDKYYWLLSVWTSINIVWYLFVSLLFRPKEKPTTPTRSLPEEEEKNLCSFHKLAKKYCIFLKCLPEKFPDFCCCCCCWCCCSNSGGDSKQDVYNVNLMVA
ncbi:hypothetical protein CsatB_002065 [Cannabis sativa]